MKCTKCHTENPEASRFCAGCGTQLLPSKEIPVTETLETPTEELTRGTTFANRFEIIEELGKGGMGKVYRVEDKKIKEEVALKLIKPEIASDKKTIERFSNELKMTRKIAHRNVCKMYDLGEEKGTHYITMEYVPGEDLKGSIRRMGPLTAGKTLFIAKQVCEGLAEAHRLGVTHRDLKPQNIMIDKDGNARIMDFGIACSLKAKGITGAGVMIGTPEYMSPEQAEVKEVDQRSDIYSLGVILYEMVTGKVPFEEATPLGIAMKHKTKMPKDPRELNAQIPEDLSQVILRCMEKDKNNRYQSAREVRSELTRIERGIPTTDREVPKKKPITSKEITVTLGMRKLLIPTLVFMALIITILILWHPWSQKEAIPTLAGRPSIAVLPFEDVSPQKDQEYFCDGLTEELINTLSSIRELKVVARTSAFSFKGKDVDVREIGKKLNVETVIEGSVRKAGNRLRITAQLVNVADGYHLWSERFDRELADVFAIQDEISLAITDRLKLKLLGQEKVRMAKRHTEDLEAYDLYLRGLYFRRKLTRDSIPKAMEYFNRAIEKDPDNALAFAGLAYSYMVLAWYTPISPQEAYPKAKKAALKALELDDQLAEAYESLAGVSGYLELNWEGAKREIKRAIELKPGYAWAYFHLSNFLLNQARFDDAIKALQKALELDPLNVIFHRNLGEHYFYAGQLEKAIETLQRTVEMDPTFPFTHILLAYTYMQKTMYKEALAEMKKEMDIPKAILDANIGIVYAHMGMREEALKILNKYMGLSTQEFISPYFLALLCFALGEKELGFQWLEKAYEERDVWTAYIKIDFLLDSVRKDSRFKALLKKMNLD
jgi:serine/threonine protein kinase/tetratricopeptide (TPR) repeat protein